MVKLPSRTPSKHRYILTSIAIAIAVLTCMQYLVPTPSIGEQQEAAALLGVVGSSKADFIKNNHGSVENKDKLTRGALGSTRGINNNNNKKKEEEKTNIKSKATNTKAAPKVNYHVVFSTSCSSSQDWESYVFFYRAMRVKQPGNITRIASGCSTKQKRDLELFHESYIKTMSTSFHVHFTPNYAKIHLEQNKNHSYKNAYKYMNKPYGLKHWMEYGYLKMRDENATATSTSSFDDDIIMLMDPDMVLLRPLVHDFTQEQVLWVVEDESKLSSQDKIVRRGHPIGQQDGYLTNEWMKLDMEFERPPSRQDGPLHYNSGPPYLATVRDFYNIAINWCELAPQVLEVYPKLFAEMYGLILATIKLKLPFTFIKSIVISDTGTAREGWPYIDQLPDDKVCDTSENNTPSTSLPIGLHYCKRYLLGKHFFGKYRMKKNIMRCDKNLLQPIPRDLALQKLNYSIDPPKADLSDAQTYKEVRAPVSDKIAKREAYMLCHMTDAVNEVLRYYKRMACTGTAGHDTIANFNETYSVHTDPSSW